MEPGTLSLREPGADALAASAALETRIRERIAAQGGWIPFSEYMRLALYEPGLGYYSGGAVKIGAAGDFVTAPELGGFLAEAIVACFATLFEEIEGAGVTELGAGTGAMARQTLDALSERGFDGVPYRILETSADFRERQFERLGDGASGVEWLDELRDDAFRGLVVANEVLDAMPVERFVKVGGRTRALGVVAAGGGFEAAAGEASAALVESVGRLEARLGTPFPDGFCSEVCLVLPAWIEALASYLERGAIALVDYGLVAREYYHADRASGWLVCHYAHHAHSDPFAYPGLQDISAWVDFSACAAAAAKTGLSVAGFTTQAQFLLDALIARGAFSSENATHEERSALKTLLLPGEMGERFKVMTLTQGVDLGNLPGRDLRARL